MKKLILTVALTASFNVSALTKGDASWCELQGRVAHQIMSARQAGVKISKTLSTVDDMPASYQPAGTEMIMAAYKETQWHSESARADAAQRFSEKFEVGCIRSMIHNEKVRALKAQNSES